LTFKEKRAEYLSRPEVKKHKREYYRNYRTKPGVKEKQLATSFRRTYGISIEQRDQMFLDQGSRCAICKSPEPRWKSGWHTDHCHETGKVRGILCHFCNVALGLLKDNLETLQAAINYLNKEK
jgi:hypothetical protein